MSKKKKRLKYAEAMTLSNILSPRVLDHENFVLESVWDRDFFGNDHPVTVEIGCGKGEFTVDLALRYPDRNFIGVDIKSDRMVMGARRANEHTLTNVCFVRMRIECLAAYFPENLFSEGYITFPDPHVSNPSGRRRLTSSRFLNLYKQVFKKDNTLHLKTDSRTLYDFSLESIPENGGTLIQFTGDLYNENGDFGEVRQIQTTYEKRYLSLNKTIKYIRFSL